MTLQTLGDMMCSGGNYETQSLIYGLTTCTKHAEQSLISAEDVVVQQIQKLPFSNVVSNKQAF